MNYTNIVLPDSAFDLHATYPYDENVTNYFPIRRAANELRYTLGRTLLQEAYMMVDYERAYFTVAQAAFPDPLTLADIQVILPPGNPLSHPTSSPHSGLRTSAKAGIAVGCAVFPLLFAVLAVFFYRRRRRHTTRTHGKTSELGGTAVSEADSPPVVSPTPHKVLDGSQELGGTPRAELASPLNEKSYVSVNDIPQELATPPLTLRPRFVELTVNEYNLDRSRVQQPNATDDDQLLWREGLRTDSRWSVH
ncbi:hypothetical protein BU23DRAFT_550452 [Bimuria novae-zelandiae CBS 107.79]|uniref:Uncharacterized protein n=1 Tax=Bimuria novae-zelandiae CBS 107.79 TaxID=1447943 RepID=A0A6A5VSB9_9PLEO|nr:hypothetical protein BU23DRAFT_550452 [Bimuria novae-zelandiae CBS 107.79]